MQPTVMQAFVFVSTFRTTCVGNADSHIQIMPFSRRCKLLQNPITRQPVQQCAIPPYTQDLIGVNISERIRGTERTTKKRKKREFGLFTARGATGTVTNRLDARRILSSYDNLEYLYPGPYTARTKSQVNKQAKHTHFYKQIGLQGTIKINGDLLLRNTQFQFHLTLSRAHSVFSPDSNAKKAGHLK